MTKNPVQYLILEDAYYTALDISETMSRLRPDYLMVGLYEEVSSAIHKLRQGGIDFIIADTEVADGNSIEVFAQVGILTPVIFISGYADQADFARNLNMADFILKPVTPVSLERALLRLDANRNNINARLLYSEVNIKLNF